MLDLPGRSLKRRETAVSTSNRETSVRKPAPNYFSRREQVRLFVLVGSLMLVVVLMERASHPKFWQWMWGRDPDQIVEAEVTDRDIDTRLPPVPNPDTMTDPDVFLSPSDDSPATAPEETVDEGYYPGVDPRLLLTVRDDMLFLPSETEAWYHLLAVLQKADAENLEKASLGRIGFVQLFEQAKEYRGRLITIRGTVRRAHQVLAPLNNYGIEGYWILWLWPAGGPSSPILIYSLQMPEGFPQGMELNEEAAFTGFSYKRKAYQAAGRVQGGETRTAPLVMAKIGRWTPPPPEGEEQTSYLWPILAAAGGAALLAVGLATFVYYRSGVVSPTAAQYSNRRKAAPGAWRGVEQTDSGSDVREEPGRMASEGDPHEEK